MKDEIISKTKIFTAKLIPTHIIGVDNYYQVFHNSSRVGDIDGDKGYYQPMNTGLTFSSLELMELAKLLEKIKKLASNT